MLPVFTGPTLPETSTVAGGRGTSTVLWKETGRFGDIELRASFGMRKPSGGSPAWLEAKSISAPSATNFPIERVVLLARKLVVEERSSKGGTSTRSPSARTKFK